MKTLLEKDIKARIIQDKCSGVPDAEIGRRYGITYRQLEEMIRKSAGVSISAFKRGKKITTLYPKDFKEEATTVWSFKSRGNWATHSGEYRGNWSPYIPRNIILKYSEPGDLVLDYFCGAGTTGVEAKLLGRRCVALDINEKAIELAKKNIDFVVPQKEPLSKKQEIYETELFVGDARNLSCLRSNSVDLICSHPPYANIIHYTEGKEGDLSWLDVEHFLLEMERVAKESFRVLKPGRQCAILIGDMRQHKYVIPLGFKLINIFLDAGFKLKEFVIKRQHNCKTTGFWYNNSIKFNFLLLAHEYLPIFEKPVFQTSKIREASTRYGLLQPYLGKPLLKRKLQKTETTTVWIFQEDSLERLLNKNVIDRYSKEGCTVVDINFNSIHPCAQLQQKKKKDLLFIKSTCLNKENHNYQSINSYIAQLREVLKNGATFISEGGYCVIQTKDIRIGKYLEPMAKRIVDSVSFPNFPLREVIIVVTGSCRNNGIGHSDLNIVHQYLLVYKKVSE